MSRFAESPAGARRGSLTAWRRWLMGLAWVLASAASNAQTFPSRPLTMVVPFAPGGATDVVARLLAEEVGQTLGQVVVVENKPGAAGALGAQAVARSKPDGYTLCLCGGGPAVILALLDPKLPYSPQRDLTPVILSHLVQYVVVVHRDSPYDSLAALVTAAKGRPGQVSYGSTGAGGPAHLGMALFERASSTSFLHVPYKGESNVLNDLLGHQLDVALLSVQSASAQLAGGRVRALALWSAQRSPVLPEVRTVAEQGYPGYEAGTFVGVHVAADTPASVVDTLYRAFAAALAKPQVKDKLLGLGFTPMGLDPARYAVFLDNERKKWAKVIADTGTKGRE